MLRKRKSVETNHDVLHHLTGTSHNLHEYIGNGIIALLNLPVRSNVALDGNQQILQRDDFVGISQVPSNIFHLIVIRKPENNSNQGHLSPAIGLLIYHDENMTSSTESTNDDVWIVARKYDPLIEELSSNVDSVDPITRNNLCQSITNNNIPPNRVVPYKSFCQGLINNTYQKHEIQTWQTLTCYINKTLLQKRDIRHGDKVIPGSYQDNVTDSSNDLNIKKTNDSDKNKQDGIEIVYPPIPCISIQNMNDTMDQTSTPNRVFFKTQHLGTTKYLTTLTPSERTNLFMRQNQNATNDQQYDLLQKIIHKYYDNEWQLLIGDFQLAFVLFMHLGCLSSLIHWRDLLSMLSLELYQTISKMEEAQPKDTKNIKQSHTGVSDLYNALMETLSIQIQSIDTDFFEDENMEYSKGNFLVPALRRIYFAIRKILHTKAMHPFFFSHTSNGYKKKAMDASRKLKQLTNVVFQRLSIDLETSTSKQKNISVKNNHNNDDTDDSSIDSNNDSLYDFNEEDINNDFINNCTLDSLTEKNTIMNKDPLKAHNISNSLSSKSLIMDQMLIHDKKKSNYGKDKEEVEDEDEDDDEGPIIVPMEEIEASLARSSQEQEYLSRHTTSLNAYSDDNHSDDVTSAIHQYPLLFSSKRNHEDILMTCARILDEKNDVSLVREAASYLEKVEISH